MGKAAIKKRKFIRGERSNEGRHQGSPKDPVLPQHKKNFKAPSSKTIFFFIIAFILVSSFAAYFNGLSNGFVYDDAWQVLRNRWITDVRYIPEIFSNNVWGFRQDFNISNYYRPAMHLVYMLTYHIFGPDPRGFHLVNILFHAGVCVMVFLVASRLLKESRHPDSVSYLPPFVAALLFATHPVHAEAVAWVAGLPDLSFTFFYFLSFYLYIRSAGSDLFDVNYLLSVISFFLATLFKEPALTLPLIILAYDYAFDRKEVRCASGLKKYIPYLIVSGIYFLLRFKALHGFAPLKRHAEINAYQSLINVLPLFVQYLEKLFLPINLNAFYVLHPISSLCEARGILSLIITAVFVVLTFSMLKTNKVVFIALLFIAIPLLPVLYIPAVGPNTFAERYLYISSFGIVLLFALLVDWAKAARPAAASGLVAIALVLAGLYSWATVSRNAVWKDDYTLFSDAAGKSPDADIPRFNLGLNLQNKGKWDEAIDQYQIALKLNPDYTDAHVNLGVTFFSKGLIDEAIEQYQIALKLNPEYANTHINLGVAFFRKGRTDEAIEQYQAALKLHPESVDAHVNLGAAFSDKGWTDKAIERYQIALKLQPENVDAHVNLGAAFGNKGWIDKAIEEFKIALQLDPASVNARKNLVRCYELNNSPGKIIQNRK
jgi:Tfp pilus assembly protein PilF